MKLSRKILPALAALVLAVSVSAASKTYLIDFGAPEHTPYVFKKGDFGLATAPEIISEPATGAYEGFGYKNVTFKLGATSVLSFPSVGGYNLDESSSSTAALIGSFFFSNPDRTEVGSPVKFTLTTTARTDKITVAGISSVQDGQKALVTIETAKVLVDSNTAFVTIVTKLTGKTTYAGSFASESGAGEANLGGLLITIEN